ncbi:class I SAM-dependent methyltransferase [Sulfitobacter sabulilitoris]|uniref:Class I SAM-dependent methyltransferase n=1 Tax=Sulfitobacter sabulilitoris TaxID=2562655 RepID=A0A5S3PZT0_9RHOB|nr:class I SAM-dependent methyltransferase [Sulfitobacter sabulilitoris]TMM49543.1 class I SAM-dependent methyltransferase [Sulfitobacter sabulilitoris]
MNVQNELGQYADATHTSLCRLCGAALRHSVVDLGMSPPCESFLPRELVDAAELYYPLHVMVCEDCMLVQLRDYVQPEDIFTEYAYFSSFSTSWVEHARQFTVMATERFGLGPQSFVVELASNDGYLLQHFGPLGVPVLGVEPAANVAAAAERRGVPTRVEFFGTALADRMLGEGLAADLIIGNNVLAQVPDLNDFVQGASRLLKPDGVATFEFPHVGRLLSENQFDTIYHEHYSYFSLLTIERMAANHGLHVFDVETLPTHGGSLRVYLAKIGAAHAPTPAVADFRASERAEGLYELATYQAFEESARRTKRELLAFLITAKDQGKTICGYGAPGKGNTLLNYCGIGTDFLDFTVDRNPYKHGRFTPGMRIPIQPVEAIDAAKPDYILILPWNLRDEIVSQMGHVADWGGSFVVPIPRVEIVTPEGRSL